jgi:cytochrome c
MSLIRPSKVLATLALISLGSVAPAAEPKADAEAGKAIFSQRCGICHAVSTEPGGPVAGPLMVGIIGRKAGSVPGFAMYSEALKKSGITWSVKTLDDFLIMPMQKVPGTVMPMMLPDDQERADVVAYITTLKPAK